MLNTKNWKRMWWAYAGIILMVLVAIALSSGCLEKNPIDKLIEGKHEEIDPYKGEKGDYEKQSKELDKQVQEQSGEPDEQIDATDVVIDAEPTPKGTVDEYCRKSLEGDQICLNLNSDGTCTFIWTKIPQDVEVVLDGKWDEERFEDETYVITEVEGDKDVFLKLDNGNLCSGLHGIFFSPKATPLKSAVGIYTKKTEYYVIEFELKADGTFEERVIYSPDHVEKCRGIWSEGEHQILTVVTINEAGGRATAEYLRLDNTKLADNRNDILTKV